MAGRGAIRALTCGGTAVAPCVSGCPSILQNFAFERLTKPQRGQIGPLPLLLPLLFVAALVADTMMVALGEMAGIETVAGDAWFGKQCCKAMRIASAL